MHGGVWSRVADDDARSRIRRRAAAAEVDYARQVNTLEPALPLPLPMPLPMPMPMLLASGFSCSLADLELCRSCVHVRNTVHLPRGDLHGIDEGFLATALASHVVALCFAKMEVWLARLVTASA